jgi:hypothetical protein
MALERLLGTTGSYQLSAVNTQDAIGGTAQMLGYDFATSSAGKFVTRGYVRMIPVGSFVAGTKWQLWERNMTNVALSELKLEVELGGLTGSSGQEIEVPSFTAYAIGQNVRHLTTIYHPSTQLGNYWYQSGFGNPVNGSLDGFCIYNNGEPSSVPPIFEGFTNGGFAVDIGIDDEPPPPSGHPKGAEFLGFFL